MPVALVPSPNPVAAGTPPQGASPLSQPVPNKGLEVAGLAELSQIVRQLEQVIPKLGVASEAGRAAAEAVLKLAKHVPAGSVAQGPQVNALQALIAHQRQMQPMIAAMRGGVPAPASPVVAPPPAAKVA